MTQTVCIAPEQSAFPNRFSETERRVAQLLEISNTHGEWRPDALTLDRALLNKLLDGKPLTEDEDEEIVMWTEWVPQMEGAMWWWRDLAWQALEELVMRGRIESDVDRRLAELALLEEGVYSALCQARREHFKELMPGFESAYSEIPTRRLARSYGLYVRYIDALLLEVFPGLSRDLLLNPFPAWGITSRRPERVA